MQFQHAAATAGNKAGLRVRFWWRKRVYTISQTAVGIVIVTLMENVVEVAFYKLVCLRLVMLCVFMSKSAFLPRLASVASLSIRLALVFVIPACSGIEVSGNSSSYENLLFPSSRMSHSMK